MLSGVIDVDSRGDANCSRRTSDDEETLGAEIFTVVRGIETHGVREFAGAVGERGAMRVDPAPLGHEVQSMDGFDGAYEDRVGLSARSNDDVERPVHAVQEKHVGVSWWAEHGFGASRTSAACAVRREIFRAPIRFALDDAACRRAIARSMHEDRSNQGGGDVENVAVVKGTR